MSHRDDDDDDDDAPRHPHPPEDPCESTEAFNAAGWGFDPWRDAGQPRRSWAQDERWSGEAGPVQPFGADGGDGTLRLDARTVDAGIEARRATAGRAARPARGGHGDPALDDDAPGGWGDGTLRLADAADRVEAYTQQRSGPAREAAAAGSGASYEAGRLRRGAVRTDALPYRDARPERERTWQPEPEPPAHEDAMEATAAIAGLALPEALEAVPQRALPERHVMLFDAHGRATPLPLELDTLHIGRNLSHHIVLADTQCSRHHASIIVTHDRVEILDLDTRNGTFVNDCAIKRAVWRPGDVVRIGEHRLTLIIGAVERRHYTLTESAAAPQMLELPRQPHTTPQKKPGLLGRLLKRGS